MANTLRITFQPSGTAQPFTIYVLTVSTDMVQTLNIGSQSGGSGAGKVTFNPFSFSKKPDSHSPELFSKLCNGNPFQKVSLDVLNTAGASYLNFTMGLVALRSLALSVSAGDSTPVESITVEYGHAAYSVLSQNPDGSAGKSIGAGWDSTKNVAEDPAEVGT